MGMEKPYSITNIRNFNGWGKQFEAINIENINNVQKSKDTSEDIINKIQSNLMSIRHILNLFPEFEAYFTYYSDVIATYRKKEFSKSSQVKNIEEPELPSLVKELDYLEEFIEMGNHLITISKIIAECFIMHVDSQKELYPNLKFNIGTLDNVRNSENDKITSRNHKILKVFINYCPVPFIDEEGNCLENKMAKLIEFCKIYKDDIYKLTFAIRANYVIDKFNANLMLVEKECKITTRKITQSKLVQKSGLDKSTVSNYFIGKTLPSTEFLILFSEMTGVPIDYVVNPRVELSVLKEKLKLNSSSEFYIHELSNEMGYVLHFLFGRWSQINDVTHDQSELICATLSYLIRDLFLDEDGDANIPTTDKPNATIRMLKGKKRQHFKYIERDLQFTELLIRYNTGRLVFNKNSVLYLLGRYLFDHQFRFNIGNNENSEKLFDDMYLVNRLGIEKLEWLLRSPVENPRAFKTAIKAVIDGSDKIDSPDDMDSDFYDNMSSYYLEMLIHNIRTTLIKHQQMSKKTDTRGYFESQFGVNNTIEKSKLSVEEMRQRQQIVAGKMLKRSKTLAKALGNKPQERKKLEDKLEKEGYEFHLNPDAVYLHRYSPPENHSYDEQNPPPAEVVYDIEAEENDDMASEEVTQEKPKKKDTKWNIDD